MTRPHVFSNVGWNLSGTIINVLTGFITLPYLIKQFGAETYGIWILIGAMVAYFSLLDCGVALAVGRLVAKTRLSGDIESLNGVLSTGGVILGVICILTCAFVFIGAPFFFDLFHVGPAQSLDVHRALVICGLLAAVTLPTLIASAVLWGYERFDLYNIAEITSTLVRMTLIFVFVNRESHLESLAWISVASTTISVLGLASVYGVSSGVWFENFMLSVAGIPYSHWEKHSLHKCLLS
jgi:O-antigen/teichoic acid export membrane protein